MTDVVALAHLALGAAFVIAAWLLARRVAAARRAGFPALLLDIAPLALGAGLLGLATGRPVFAGVLVLALGAGFALADHTMRETLLEPAVFSESVELPQLFSHPHLYLPFAGPALVVGGAAAGLVLEAALLVFEPPLMPPYPAAAFGLLAAIAAAAWLFAREPLLGTTATLLRRLGPKGEPFADMTALGPFATLLTHTVIARAERAERQRSLAAPLPLRRGGGPEVPVIVVQCESFFDARRLSPQIAAGLLPGFDACCASASLYGRLAVPGLGANTMRAEFAVLTGIPDHALGYDRFNPYYALARVPIRSQVWRLREAGYRTICLHPFDRRFFRRDLAMPALGFERFLGRETLGGGRVPPYRPDPDFARDILRVLDAEGPGSFIFAITMGNHGPWTAKGPPLDPAVAALFDPTALPEGAALLRYLDGLRRSDEMLRVLMAGLEQRRSPAVLAFYGDHLPSLWKAFRHFGFAEAASDYVVWPGNGAPRRRDLAAHELGVMLVDDVLGAAAGPREAAGGASLAMLEPASFGR